VAVLLWVHHRLQLTERAAIQWYPEPAHPAVGSSMSIITTTNANTMREINVMRPM
jgi:hypothetical protein